MAKRNEEITIEEAAVTANERASAPSRQVSGRIKMTDLKKLLSDKEAQKAFAVEMAKSGYKPRAVGPLSTNLFSFFKNVNIGGADTAFYINIQKSGTVNGNGGDKPAAPGLVWDK